MVKAELTHAPPPHTARDCLTPPLSGFGGGALTTEPLLLIGGGGRYGPRIITSDCHHVFVG